MQFIIPPSQAELLVAQRSFLQEASLLWPGCRASFFVWLFLIGVEIIYFQGNIRLSFFVGFLSYDRVIYYFPGILRLSFLWR